MDIYAIENTADILSPGVVLFHDLIKSNIATMIDMAGSADRLRPHCKTHKTSEIASMLIGSGIVRHKAATFAEAEMLANAGATDVFLAYNPVGPNIRRTIEFRRQFPNVRLSVTGDHEGPLLELSTAAVTADVSVDVFLDLDTGLHRTGVAPGAAAAALYRHIDQSPGLRAAGLHCYDGHHHQSSAAERLAGVTALWSRVSKFRDALEAVDLRVPKIVCGGTPSFPMYAGIDDPAIECSPGTCVLHDAGYGGKFDDMVFTPAALILTRVISRPTFNRVTLDLGTKAVAADPPAGHRLTFPDLPDAKAVLQNEEHLVLETPHAGRFVPGDALLAIPTHICPTMALHRDVTVIQAGRVAATWSVPARDRQLTV